MHRHCGLCGHPEDLDECGRAEADGRYLCHTDDHSCYHRWTVYKHRPLLGVVPEHINSSVETEDDYS